MTHTINTVNTKLAQLQQGYFKTGIGSETILIIGSCRSVPYLNYLHEWNEANGQRFTISFIDPYNWCFDLQDNRVNLEEKITALETDENILFLLRSTKICIHEYYQHFGMFCFDKNAEKNIYQFGLNPDMDICLPNFNDLFILAGDILTFDAEIRKKAIADFNVGGKLSKTIKDEIFEKSQENLDKFYAVCRKSDVPEMGDYFGRNFIEKRLWWSYNHVSKEFTIPLFEMMNNKFLKLDLTNGFNRGHVDMFANNFTRLTDLDKELYNFKWEGEEVLPVAAKLFF